MNTVSPGNGHATERSRQFLYRHFQRQYEVAARLSEMDLPPVEFYQEFLQRVLAGTGGIAGVVWSRSAAGQLQLDKQINLKQIGLDEVEVAWAAAGAIVGSTVARQPGHSVRRRHRGKAGLYCNLAQWSCGAPRAHAELPVRIV